MSVHPFPTVEHVDVLIVGAGLSGIGAGYYLQKEQPQKTFAILEARGASGGTWDLFRYPGIRSDSDLHTFGYEFKPWVNDKAIADGGAILDYLREAAEEHGIDRKIRYHHKVCAASWSTPNALWTVDVEIVGTGARKTFTCKWLFSAAGYYRYDEGFTPQFEGVSQFKGQLVHPQHWPENFDYAGKRVLIIGSGATAVTLVPAMTDKAAHVTMLQRTPTYVITLPSADLIANALRKIMPDTWAYAITRRKNIGISRQVWRLCQKYPRAARRFIRWTNKIQLPKGYPVDEHFNPPYNPWDQRLCAVPDGDLFKAISDGKASVVTDHIDTFVDKGVKLKSGKVLEADIIITATGLNLQMFGGAQLQVDGKKVALSERVAYKGMMLTDLPNFAFIVGYTNSSWTLKVGPICEHFSRLLTHMDRMGYDICYPALSDPNMPTRPLLDFGAGYVQRVLPFLPRQGAGAPWLMSMDYLNDVEVLRRGSVEDAHLHFEKVGEAPQATVPVRRAVGA